MQFSSLSELTLALLPGAGDFRTPGFHLANELATLDRVKRVNAVEAVVFHCARIEEVLLAAALDRIGVPASPRMFDNLVLLEQFALLPTTLLYMAHGLRRLGNDVRHLRRSVTELDSELACLYTERWLDWYFCRYRFGPRLPSLLRSGAALHLCGTAELSQLLEKIDSPDFQPRDALSGLDQGSRLLWTSSPAIAALVAELLLDRDTQSKAAGVLEHALECFPNDLRLRQLQGLYFSRCHRAAEALSWLEPLLAEFPHDEETIGILAGVYKRQWWDNRKNQTALDRSHHAYRAGWDRSDNENAYLGINAAATALFSGEAEMARQIAAQVYEVLVRRREFLAKSDVAGELVENYWQLVTLAEAAVLLGRDDEARGLYDLALKRHASDTGKHRSSLEQLAEILAAQKRPIDPEAFLTEGKSR